MNRNWAAALLLVGMAGCTSPNSSKTCPSGTCSNPEFPYCDTEGVISGEPQTCIGVTCTPGAVEACLGDDALTCNATGDGYDHVLCELGCKTAPMPHCGYIEPRYLPDVCDSRAPEVDLVVMNSGSFDPNLDSNCNGGLVEQSGAPSICVVHYRNISIKQGATLRVLGTAQKALGRPIAFVADEELSIEGTLDVAARGFVNGPGGGVITSGAGPTITSTTLYAGGGGAGGKTAGASGGNATADGGAMNGGLAMADPALLAAFIGGAAAVGPTNDPNTLAAGGGGGGAATLVSCFGDITVSGTISAGGGGGSGGVVLFGGPFPAYSGGAGGYVVLQGSHVSITGGVFANGGAGGAGAASTPLPGQAGSDAFASAADAAQGGLPELDAGRGGGGGIIGRPPSVGAKPSASGGRAGGGGGSVGFLQTYTPEGVEPTLMPSAVSPAFQPNATIKTR